MVPRSYGHPRGRHLPAKVEKLKTNNQGKVEQLVRKYTNGGVNESEFRKGLRDYGVKTDPTLDKLITRNEAGDFVSHNQLGKEALRRVIEPSRYNHANKINLLNPSYLVKERQGVDPVVITNELQQKAHEDTYLPQANQRTLHQNTTNREIFGSRVYLGVKGKSKIDVQHQLDSSEPNLTKWDKGNTGKLLYF
jgi:hypothetical protein